MTTLKYVFKEGEKHILHRINAYRCACVCLCARRVCDAAQWGQDEEVISVGGLPLARRLVVGHSTQESAAACGAEALNTSGEWTFVRISRS